MDVRHAAHRGRAAARDRGDGLRRRLPHPDPPDRHDRAQGSEQLPERRARTTPGSPYAIGSPDGGHDAIHPDLGTFEDFDAFVARTQELGMEVAMDIALQCSPDHPYVQTNPEWFTTRADGTIAYAENPPKKYQDIYPLNFDNDPAGVVCRDAADDPGLARPRGADLPGRQPAHQAGRVLAVAHRRRRPRPPRHDLAGRGVHQAGDDAHAGQGRLPAVVHLLRVAQREVGARGVRRRELAGEAAAYMRPSFWPTTHDILTPYMQFGGPAAWKLRAALAATLVADLRHLRRVRADRARRPPGRRGADRQREVPVQGPPLVRTTSRVVRQEGQSLAGYLTRINEIRREHPALHWLRNITLPPRRRRERHVLLQAAHPAATAARTSIIVVANLDPHSTRESTVHLDMPALGLDYEDGFAAHDLITGAVLALG